MNFRDDIEVGGGNFIRLKDGESVTGLLRGEPVERYELWENRKKISEFSEKKPGTRFRFSINMVVKEGNEYVAKVLEGGAQIYKQLATLSKDYEMEDTVIKISRTGSGLDDTEYAVIPVPPKVQPTKEALEAIKAVKLQEIGTPSKEIKNFAPGADDSEKLPF